jgi:hypothetical protein
LDSYVVLKLLTKTGLLNRLGILEILKYIE